MARLNDIWINFLYNALVTRYGHTPQVGPWLVTASADNRTSSHILLYAKRTSGYFHLSFLARRKRFELLTFGSVDQRSIQLS